MNDIFSSDEFKKLESLCHAKKCSFVVSLTKFSSVNKPKKGPVYVMSDFFVHDVPKDWERQDVRPTPSATWLNPQPPPQLSLPLSKLINAHETIKLDFVELWNHIHGVLTETYFCPKLYLTRMERSEVERFMDPGILPPGPFSLSCADLVHFPVFVNWLKSPSVDESKVGDTRVKFLALMIAMAFRLYNMNPEKHYKQSSADNSQKEKLADIEIVALDTSEDKSTSDSTKSDKTPTNVVNKDVEVISLDTDEASEKNLINDGDKKTVGGKKDYVNSLSRKENRFKSSSEQVKNKSETLVDTGNGWVRVGNVFGEDSVSDVREIEVISLDTDTSTEMNQSDNSSASGLTKNSKASTSTQHSKPPIDSNKSNAQSKYKTDLFGNGQVELVPVRPGSDQVTIVPVSGTLEIVPVDKLRKSPLKDIVINDEVKLLSIKKPKISTDNTKSFDKNKVELVKVDGPEVELIQVDKPSESHPVIVEVNSDVELVIIEKPTVRVRTDLTALGKIRSDLKKSLHKGANNDNSQAKASSQANDVQVLDSKVNAESVNTKKRNRSGNTKVQNTLDTLGEIEISPGKINSDTSLQNKKQSVISTIDLVKVKSIEKKPSNLSIKPVSVENKPVTTIIPNDVFEEIKMIEIKDESNHLQSTIEVKSELFLEESVAKSIRKTDLNSKECINSSNASVDSYSKHQNLGHLKKLKTSTNVADCDKSSPQNEKVNQKNLKESVDTNSVSNSLGKLIQVCIKLMSKEEFTAFTRKVSKYLNGIDPESRDLCSLKDFIDTKVETIQGDPKNVFLHLKGIFDEMRKYRKTPKDSSASESNRPLQEISLDNNLADNHLSSGGSNKESSTNVVVSANNSVESEANPSELFCKQSLESVNLKVILRAFSKLCQSKLSPKEFQPYFKEVLRCVNEIDPLHVNCLDLKIFVSQQKQIIEENTSDVISIIQKVINEIKKYHVVVKRKLEDNVDLKSNKKICLNKEIIINGGVNSEHLKHLDDENDDCIISKDLQSTERSANEEIVILDNVKDSTHIVEDHQYKVPPQTFESKPARKKVNLVSVPVVKLTNCNKDSKWFVMEGKKVPENDYIEIVHFDEPSSSRMADPRDTTDEEKEIEESESSNKNKRKVSTKHLKKLELALKKVAKKIRRLEEAEVDWDNDNVESNYIVCAKYKRRYMDIFNKIADYKKLSKSLDRKSDKRLRCTESRYPEINAKIQKFVNRTKEFPDFRDIRGLVLEANVELNLADAQLHDEAETIFQAVGKQLKFRREVDETDVMMSYLKEDQKVDPASLAPELDQKLLVQLKEGKKNIDNYFDDFYRQNVILKSSKEQEFDGDDNDSNSYNEDEVDSRREDDVNVNLSESRDDNDLINANALKDTNAESVKNKENDKLLDEQQDLKANRSKVEDKLSETKQDTEPNTNKEGKFSENIQETEPNRNIKKDKLSESNEDTELNKNDNRNKLLVNNIGAEPNKNKEEERLLENKQDTEPNKNKEEDKHSENKQETEPNKNKEEDELSEDKQDTEPNKNKEDKLSKQDTGPNKNKEEDELSEVKQDTEPNENKEDKLSKIQQFTEPNKNMKEDEFSINEQITEPNKNKEDDKISENKQKAVPNTIKNKNILLGVEKDAKYFDPSNRGDNLKVTEELEKESKSCEENTERIKEKDKVEMLSIN